MFSAFGLLTQHVLLAVELTVAAHDTTGGMATKISEAAMIAKLGIDVYIVKVTSLILYSLSSSYFHRTSNVKIFSCLSGSNKPLIQGLKWRFDMQHSRRLARDGGSISEITLPSSCAYIWQYRFCSELLQIAEMKILLAVSKYLLWGTTITFFLCKRIFWKSQ